MNRRTFIINSFLGLAAIPAIKLSASANQNKPGKHISLLKFFIAGYQFYKGERIEHLLAPGTQLALLREQENPYDNKAVAVYYNTHKLGFIPRTNNQIIANLLNQQISLIANIVEVNKEKSVWERVRVEVGIKAYN
jgi:hypothetical protein